MFQKIVGPGHTASGFASVDSIIYRVKNFFDEHLKNPTSIQDQDIDESFAKYKLEQNYPNLFNLTTKICFSIPKTEHVTVKVLDVLGKEVATLVDGELNTGVHSVVFDAKNLPSGVYFYRLHTENFVQQNKIEVIK